MELDLKHQRMGKKKKRRRREIRVGDAENHFYPQCKLQMEEKKMIAQRRIYVVSLEVLLNVFNPHLLQQPLP